MSDRDFTAKMDINYDIIVYTFYSILPYMYISNSYISLLLWQIPNTILSMIVFSYYLTQVEQPTNGKQVNIINGRYMLVSKITSVIEASIIGSLIPIIYYIIPELTHIANCFVVAEVLYCQTCPNIRRRVMLYYSNLLRILMYGIPLTLLQMHVSDRFIVNYLYNLILITQVQWMLKYSLIYKLPHR